MMAMMVVASATAFAGDSDAFKALKKSMKGASYADAEALVKNSIDQLANAQEKAAAYNMLVDLAYDAFNKQSVIVTENQMAKQMGQQEKPVDQELMNTSAFNAITMAIECDKYDQQPNEKGKIRMTRINDAFMEQLLRNDPIAFEQYHGNQKKGDRQSAANILPILVKKGLIQDYHHKE